MRQLLVCIFTLIPFISIATVPKDSLKLATGIRIPLKEPTYNFGTLMLDFVKTRAYDIAMKHLPESYAGKSINGYQVLLDRGRTGSNEAMKVFKESETLLTDEVDAMNKIRRLDSIRTNTLSASEAAKIASVAELARNYCFKLGEQKERVIGIRKHMESLGRYFTFEEFKKLGMHLIPTNFIMTTIGGSKPDFDMSISATYTMGEGESSQENSQNIFTAFLELFTTAKDYEEYEKEEEKFNEALKLLPNIMPSDTACYRIYKENDELVRIMYGEEPILLKIHLDSLTHDLDKRYGVMMKLVAGIEDGLLFDRIRSGIAHLGLNSFNPNDLMLVRKRVFEIADARTRVEEYKAVILNNKDKAEVIRAKEDMLDTSMALYDLIRLTDSIPVYTPLKPFLSQNLIFFKEAIQWSRIPEDEFRKKSFGKAYVFPSMNVKILENLNRLTTLESEQTIGLNSGISNALQRSQADRGLSITANWPLIPPGSGIGEQYREEGLGIWAKGSDGSYVRDRRKTWEGVMRQIYDNLELRTSDLHQQFTESSNEVKINVVKRSSEITAQTAILLVLSQNTRISQASIPIQTMGNTPTSVATENRNWELEPRYYRPQTLKGIIDQEQKKLEKFISGLPEDIRNSSGIAGLKQKHDKYLQYATALQKSGLDVLAKNMVNGATSIRAAAAGQPIDGRQIPSFNMPDIPFNPFTTEDINLIWERHTNYNLVSRQLGDRCMWFEAAGIVTDLSALHLLDFPGISFLAEADFLRSTNEALFPENMKNAIAILGGGLNGSFTTPNNETIVFDGLKGKALDYALVEYEQSRVEEQIIKYQLANPSVSMPQIVTAINSFMSSLPLTRFGSTELRQAIFPGFNFADYNDRVRLGKRLIDILYARKL